MKRRFLKRSSAPLEMISSEIATATKPSYEKLFFKRSAIKTRTGRVVYIRKEFHDRILKIVQVIGENEFSLFNYLDNILEHHFSAYQEAITELYHKKHTGVF